MFVIAILTSGQAPKFRGFTSFVDDVKKAVHYDSMEECLVGAVAVKECFPNLLGTGSLGIAKLLSAFGAERLADVAPLADLPWQSAGSVLHQYD